MTSLLQALKRLLRRIGPWVIPHRLYVVLRRRLAPMLGDVTEPNVGGTEGLPLLRLLTANSTLMDLHLGERCFILCNGPSVLKQNLGLLEGETVISVSNGYHHPLFKQIRPRYHCLPQITYGLLTEEDVIAWFREMHERLGEAELFLNCTEEPLVRRHGLFPGRTVRYVWLNEDMDQISSAELPDLSRAISRVQSVSVMCLMIAMYMGFRRIYLLGVDHDQFRTGEYKYFYSPTVLSGKDSDVAADGRVRTSRYDEFQALARLWRQYRRMRQVASASGIEILNATAGGELDEFPRVEFADLFGVAGAASTQAS